MRCAQSDDGRAATASIATALATLVLAFATFASVRSSNRTAGAAEQSSRAGLWPITSTVPTPADDATSLVAQSDVERGATVMPSPGNMASASGPT